MRIGELAASAGMFIRTLRPYHVLVLLPEPVGPANGDHEQRFRDAGRPCLIMLKERV